MPRGDSVHRVGVVRDLSAPTRKLLAKSYRARSAAQHGFRQCADSPCQLVGGAEQRAPELLPIRGVKRRDNLAAARIEHRKATFARGGLADAAAQGVERPHPGDGQRPAQPQRPRRGDANPQAGEGARAYPNRDPPDRVPASDRRRGPLELAEQRRRVQRAPPLRGAQERLEDDLAIAQRAGSRIRGRRIEADRYQRPATPEP